MVQIRTAIKTAAPFADKRWQLSRKTIWTREVDVICMGSFGIHVAVDDPKSQRYGRLVLTHMPSERIICVMVTNVDAETAGHLKKIAEKLHSTFKRAFEQPSRKEVLAMLPDWVKPWLEVCEEMNEYVDPE